uniref:Uncharacterized protein n=1 Tax=Oryza glumipatula TaxID=40148 RepID=A0A0D9YRL4_9ORYZ
MRSPLSLSTTELSLFLSLLPCPAITTVGRSPSPKLRKPNPCATNSASPSRHHHLLLSPELSSCCRRSGHPSLSLRLPPPSPGARCSGTPSPTGVPTSRPPESRRPARPLLSLLSDQRSREEEEPPKSRRENFTPSMETFAWSQTPTSNRRSVALRTPRLNAYSGRSLTTPSTSTSMPHTNRTASFISIQGADVDPDGYAKAAGNLKAQGKT